MTGKIMRPSKVAKMLAVDRVTLWRWMRQGRFPKPIQMGAHATGYLESEILDWLQQRAQARDPKPARRRGGR